MMVETDVLNSAYRVWSWLYFWLDLISLSHWINHLPPESDDRCQIRTSSGPDKWHTPERPTWKADNRGSLPCEIQSGTGWRSCQCGRRCRRCRCRWCCRYAQLLLTPRSKGGALDELTQTFLMMFYWMFNEQTTSFEPSKINKGVKCNVQLVQNTNRINTASHSTRK